MDKSIMLHGLSPRMGARSPPRHAPELMRFVSLLLEKAN